MIKIMKNHKILKFFFCSSLTFSLTYAARILPSFKALWTLSLPLGTLSPVMDLMKDRASASIVGLYVTDMIFT